MTSSRRRFRTVYFVTRTINELGESARDAFKIAQELTGLNFSMLMHWSVLVEDSLFELSGNATSQVHKFIMKPLTRELRNRFQLKQLRGFTTMTDEEILTAGE